MFYDEKADYKSYLPDIFQNIVEIDALNGAINIELDKLNARIKREVKNRFPAFCDEEGCARWEKILGISEVLITGTPAAGKNLFERGATATEYESYEEGANKQKLQTRRNAIKAKLMMKPPINMETLKNIVEAYMGLNVDVSLDEYKLHIKYRGQSRIADLQPLYETLWKTIPANMLVDIGYAYLLWNELDAQKLTFAELEDKHLTFDTLERGEWIG